ncbi:hypothetical protein D8674_036384 [Pyrus ussuriensis x Pyrus communis]|uniref:DUF7950 domain-containing protein n=1 Tax=Pyrus ussuriensis x Pyrus communis TaxID=2448454 RepID=A0A5N5GFH1_9ROSA|nr:hypothetical protein D8674_036384 [Pyrus ussuriensis x Pyrus communis]
MEGGERRRMLRRDGGGQDKPAIVNANMLRFRPIAPKPVANRAGEVGNNENSVSTILTSARRKRKYVRVSKNNVCRAKNKDPKRVVTTLQLLPEENDNNGSSNGESWRPLDPTVTDNNNDRNNNNSNPTGKEDESLGLGIPMWLRNYMGGGGGSDPTEGMRQMVAVESWVTVECLKGTCMNVQGTFGSFRSRDAARMMSDLEGDTCPGFISDGQNRVQWLNGAFKRMVSQQKRAGEIAVWLVVKEKLPYADASALIACQVKLQYTVGKDKCSRTVPCDLWRMDDGGFAWRLDVNAALTLGR